jgi:hypothetical protein
LRAAVFPFAAAKLKHGGRSEAIYWISSHDFRGDNDFAAVVGEVTESI